MAGKKGQSDDVHPGGQVRTGSDARGKQGLPPAQSRIIGECQHAPESASLIPSGEVLASRHPGRNSTDEITVFDSSGLSLQDFCVARHLLAKRATEVSP